MGVIENNFQNSLGRHIRPNAQNANNTNNQNAQNEPKDPAQFWINLGYPMEVEVDVTTEDGSTRTEVQSRFVSLAYGIALDTMAVLDVKGSDSTRAFRAAQNDLRDQLIAFATPLKPGEDRIFPISDTGLHLQIRRINEAKAPIKSADNPFVKKLAFAVA